MSGRIGVVAAILIGFSVGIARAQPATMTATSQATTENTVPATQPLSPLPPAAPVTAGATPEAAALLNFIRGISGNHTLAGQHCVPLVGSTRLVVVNRTVKKYPAIFGQDFGFDFPGTWDGINFRQRIVDEAIRRHDEGFIIVLMWHAVRPIDDEPVTFRDSIEGHLTDAQWQELITPGTNLNERWKSQVDVIAWYLRQLQDANVPVLWRPYHEMNGGWFWWGKKSGENGYKKLYRMLYERLVNFHGLKNLIWIYGAGGLSDNTGSYAEFYPGDDVVDVLATDIYGGRFAQRDYDLLQAVSPNKPIALAEVGAPPTAQQLAKQPRWTWFMCWDVPPAGGGGGPGANSAMAAYRATYNDPQVLTLDALPWFNRATSKFILRN